MHLEIRKRLQTRVSILILLFLMSSALPTLAQFDDDWTAPINVSRSGAATDPTIVAGPDGTARALWWDAFEGIATARYDGETWLSADFAPIQIVEEVNNNTVIREPSTMPTIFGDANGTSHAFWLDVVDDETGVQPLTHSRLAAGAATWSTPQVVASSAIVWQMDSAADGVLHLVYIRTAHSTALPAGIYYRRSVNGGQTWAAAVPLTTTIYFRLVQADAAYLSITANETGGIVVAWENPAREVSEYAISIDEGVSWSVPTEITTPQNMLDARSQATRPRFAFLASGGLLRLWEAVPAMTSCAIYQQISLNNGATWSPPQQVLEDLSRCPETMRIQSLPQGNLLAAMQDEGGGVTLAAANVITDSGGVESIRWSQPKPLGFSFQDEAQETTIYLGDLNVAITEAGNVLVAGHGQDDEVWVIQGQQDALTWSFTPPSPWIGPTQVSQRDISAELPAVTIDDEGDIHLLWSEKSNALQYARRNEILTTSNAETFRWSAPTGVLGTAEQLPVEPTLVIIDDHLHAVWSEINTGLILYASAFVDDAHMSSGWSAPQTVGTGTSPALTHTPDDLLHVAFAVPWNEQRGIYYSHSETEEQTWERSPSLVFDAGAADWTMVDHPAIAIDAQGGIHVTWTRGEWQDGMIPQGIYYSHSLDRGETWSEPLALAEGSYDASRVAVTQDQVHVVWRDMSSEGGIYHRWSSDSGATWSRATSIAAFENVQSSVALLSNNVEHMHLLAPSQNDVGAWSLLHATWQDERWENAEILQIGFEYSIQPGLSAALQPTRSELAVILRSHATGEDGEPRTQILAAVRPVSATQAQTVTAVAPAPTIVTTPQTTPIPTATPRPDVDPSQSTSSSRTLALGPITLPLTAVGGLLIAVIIVVSVLFYQLFITRQH